jgi:adenosine deaminase
MASSSVPDDLFTRLPKVDLHRHLEGSVRLSTLRALAKTHAIQIPADTPLEALVQVQPDDPRTAHNFLSKFKAQHPFYCTLEAIEQIAAEAVEDAAADRVRHLELRFTPTSLARAHNLAVDAVMDRVITSSKRTARQCGISLSLIASMNRHDSLELGELVARLALERRSEGIAALDLAGAEAEFPARPFLNALQAAAKGGLGITVHAGEWSGPENVWEALEEFNAVRIGHGVRILEDPAVIALAVQRGTVFEVCLTSNYQTGVVDDFKRHPIMHMIDAGLNVTINTDDPGISCIRLSDEYRLACQQLGLSLPQLYKCILSAARSSFLDEHLQQKLAAELEYGLIRGNSYE